MADMKTAKLPFRVVRGPEEKILAQTNDDGTVYFTTDTKKIYMSTATEKLPMGGNTGIYYGNADFTENPGPEFLFTIDQVEGKIPNKDDLILNTDGCFYKVEEIYDDSSLIKTSRITLAGTGSGGGGGNTPGDTQYGEISMKLLPESFNTRPRKTIVSGSECKIPVIFTAKTADGQYTGPGRYELKINGVTVGRGTLKQKNNDDDEDVINEIDITDIVRLSNTYYIWLYCYGYTGGPQEVYASKQIIITSSPFEVKWKSSNVTTEHLETTLNKLTDDYRLDWLISGGLENVTTRIEIDNVNIFETQDTTFTLKASDFEKYGINHGAHKINIYAYHYVDNDENNKLTTPAITFNALFVEEGNEDFIVSCKFYRSSISQYETIQIPVMIYSSTNDTGTAKIVFKANNIEKAEKEECKNLTWYTFAYTPPKAGFDSLQFVCGTTIFNLLLNIKSAELGVEEIPGYVFKFKATDFANDKEIQEWECNGRTIIFSDNFDWNNGGLQSGIDDPEGNGPYFKVPAGSRMTIPYNLFNRQITSTNGANFKMIFKAVNCQDYDALFVENYDGGTGLKLSAQGSLVTDGTKSSNLRYCEDSYIEYEYDYVYNENDKSKQYLISWIDGVPSKITQMEELSFSDYISDENCLLTIGSDDCDVYIYLIKFYDRHLSNREHLTNFIMDASTITNMVDRFNRNNVYKEDSEGNEYIDYISLAESNPNCNIYIYEIPYIPTSKEDVVDENKNPECCTFIHYCGDANAPIHQYEGVKMRAQGTSSMSYGMSAYNLDTKFPEEWSLDEEAIPVNYFNTKVNVASCEEANNALNQEWYNRFQPYRTKKRLAVREDGKIARDTMEFKPGVLFLKDLNKEDNAATVTGNNVFKEIPGYINAPYPRLYSICNMGNSKKNTEVFHGAGNEFECCVENTDNNSAGHAMTAVCGTFEKEVILTVGQETEQKTVKLEIPLNLSPDLFDEKGDVKPNVPWGTLDLDITVSVKDSAGQMHEVPIVEKDLSKEALWKTAMDNIFEFRYIADEDNSVMWDNCSRKFLRLVNWFATNNPANYKSLADIEKLGDTEKTTYLLNGDIGITLPQYKLKGVKESGANKDYPEEYELLGASGIIIPEATYKYDSKEYRAAKMLRESENYLVLDSIVYHYLFIERHTMADNVSKNTFWNTEDGYHWDLTKNYDNDTADGIDNNGDLLFDYGYEIMDRSSLGASVFNDGFTAAWLNFVYYMPASIKRYVYKNLANKGAWKAADYLKLFKDNWQDYIPEACWIESFYRKYFRPFEVYNNTSYLSRLDNGKKTHQRKQYETYQEQYMDSKYWNLSESSNIQWRSADPDPDNRDEIYFDATLYADGYVVGAVASGHNPNISQRAKKGDKVKVSYSPGGSLNDATGYLYFPNLYTKLENVERMKPQKLDVSQANKLKTLSLDASKNNMQENLLVQATTATGDRLSLNNNIQELIIKNCSKVAFGVNLSGNNRLTNLDLTGSSFTSVVVNNCPVESIKLYNPQSLRLNNLYYLTQANFSISSYARLKQIDINNIDFSINDKINSKNLSKVIVDNIVNYVKNQQANGNVPDSYLNYKLTNVGWTFNTSDGINDNSIPILDLLLRQEHSNSVATDADALTGFGIISNEAYSGNNALALYNKYGIYKEEIISETEKKHKSYPHFNLDFGDKLSTITIKNGNGVIAWSRQIDSFANIDNSLLTNGSMGAFNARNAIAKNADNNYVFTFTNSWKYTFASGETGVIASAAEGDYCYLDLSKLTQNMSTEEIAALKSDVIIEPVYDSEQRLFTIEFKYGENDNSFHKVTALFGTKFNDVKPKTIPVKDDSGLDLNMTYKLKGYSYDNSENPSIIDESQWAVKEDTILYPVFETVDVYSINYEEYLNIQNNVLRGLNLADNGEPIYQGRKIVIPGTVTSIYERAFENNTTIKKIFTKEGSTINTIGLGAFAYSNVEYFDFDHCEVKIIDQNAFQACPFSAEDYDGVMTLPKGLISIGKNAFNGGGMGSKTFAGSTGMRIVVPASVTTLGQNAISNMGGASNVIVQIGYEEDLSQLDISNINLEDPWYGLIHSNGGYPDKDIRALHFFTNKYNTTSSINDKQVWYIMCGGSKEDEIIDISCSPGLN